MSTVCQISLHAKTKKIKAFGYFSMTVEQNKLECLSLASFYPSLTKARANQEPVS
jgi:hypothetical protein